MSCWLDSNGSRRGLLLHSRDNLQTWTVYQLPYYFIRFEKLDGHNLDCLTRPPVIIMSGYFGPTNIYITIPVKQPDGTLVIPTPTLVGDGVMEIDPHSGDGNNVITHADKVFIVYARLSPPPGHSSSEGSPTYAITYDINTKQITEPVLVGFGGIVAEDPHNWPAITIDGNGILHVIMNGHHDPFRYAYSTSPYSTAAWSSPINVSSGTSYGSINCDWQNTLHVITRCSNISYNFRLTYHRKKTGQNWEADNNLVNPFKSYYKVWFHKIALDPVTQDSSFPIIPGAESVRFQR